MKLLVCGDFTTKNRGLEAVERNCALSPSVCSIIEEHDATIINLEAPVVCGDAKEIDKIGPHLRTSLGTVAYLKKCGVDFVTLANNHFYDYGDTGVKDTMESLSQNEVRSVGGGRNDGEKSNPIFLNNEICVLNCCESEFSIGYEMGSNKLDPIKNYYDILEHKKDYFVIVVVHGGHEGYQLPSPRMKQLYRFFIDCGANVVINHHQHCYSGYENYHGGMIFYGLGNFFFDPSSKKGNDRWYEGYMVGLDVWNGKLNKYSLFPYFQCKDNNVETRLMEENDFNEFLQKIDDLNKIIADDVMLQDAFDKFAQKVKRQELVYLVPFSNRIMQALYKRALFPSLLSKKKRLQILNMMRCESHRDLCIRLLSNS